MLGKIKISLICLAMVGCGTRSSIGSRDAGTSGDRAATPDVVVANSDGFTISDAPVLYEVLVREDGLPDVVVPPDIGPGGNDARPEIPFEAAPTDLVAAFPEVQPVDAPDLAEPRDGEAESTGESGTRDGGLPDGASDVPPEAAREVQPFVVDGALASFCSGDVPHMIVNGIESYPVVTGRDVLWSCCYGGAFTATTATFAEPIVVSWRTTATPGSAAATLINLSSPPTGWTIRVVAGCDRSPAEGGCDTPGEAHESGFQGVLELVGDYSQFDSKVDMSICLHFAAPAGGASPVLQTLDFYAPHVSWRN
jgi:hypothetical protein